MIADSRHLPLKDQSINCIITSPPYWSLRKYDIPDLIWDVEEGCEHEWGDKVLGRNIGDWSIPSFQGYEKKFQQGQVIHGQFCLHCSAWRGQLGLEPTIELYLNHLLQIMDECWRVLREDGTCWINIGDSYGGSGGAGGDYNIGGLREGQPKYKQGSADVPLKSLCLIPERFAIEMVNGGWILRNKLIWHKPNCMPASVKDRFTVDFEPVFFFVKSRKYWFEQQYEPVQESTILRYQYPNDGGNQKLSYGDPKISRINPIIERPGHKEKLIEKGRNRRCVWTISTQPYPESHFATFPEALIEPMIRAGCPKEICVKCGKAREVIYEGTSKEAFNIRVRDVKEGRIKHTDRVASEQEVENYQEGFTHVGEGKKLKGYTNCGCNAGFRPGIVLDPFCGSGTTMRVAEKLNRVGIGFDLGYEELQGKRMSNIQKELLA